MWNLADFVGGVLFLLFLSLSVCWGWTVRWTGGLAGDLFGARTAYIMKDFVIEASRVAKLRHDSGLGVEQFLASLVQPTADLARPPISKFHVGAVGLGYSGRVFRGVNLEFEGLPLNYTVHAEQFLVANALQHGEKRIVFLAVSAAPCGHCRYIH